MEGLVVGLIDIDDVSFRYITAKRPSLRNISCRFDEGTVYAVIGPNGAGKTSLCNLIRGFIPQFYDGSITGAVYLRGEPIAERNLGHLGIDIGLVFQNPFTQITGVRESVFEEIAYSLENLGVEPTEIRRRTDAIIDRLGITTLRDRKPYELSGGERQRVAIASIMVMEPGVLILDEPTSQLDPQSTEEIFAIVAKLKNDGTTLIMVEHKIDLIAEFADRVLVMHDGRLILNGSPGEVFRNPLCRRHGVPIPTVTEAAMALYPDRGGTGWNPPVTYRDGVRLFHRGALT